MKFWFALLSALVTYVLAAPLTSRISMDLSQTDWTSLWTYFFWALGIPIWIVLLAIGGFGIMAIGAFIEKYR